MNIKSVKSSAFSMPLTSPTFPRGMPRFTNREYLIITYRTDAKKLRELVPEPLEIDMDNPLVKYEFIRMPDSTGFGDYTESGQVIPVTLNGRAGTYVHSMYLDDHGPTAAGREVWGFPKKMGHPTLEVDVDTLVGELRYGKVKVATATMGYKFETLDAQAVQAAIEAPNFLLKIVPHVDGSPRILELVEYACVDVQVKGAWSGPVGLELHSHALAPVAQLPVLEIVSGVHILADLTLGFGHVVHDYMADGAQAATAPRTPVAQLKAA